MISKPGFLYKLLEVLEALSVYANVSISINFTGVQIHRMKKAAIKFGTLHETNYRNLQVREHRAFW